MALRLAFLGTPDFAVPTLSELIGQGHDIAAVYSQPARPKNRGLGEEPSPIAKLAATHGLALRTPVTLRDAAAQADFSLLDLDAAIVVAYGLILPKPILEAPRLGCFNLHGSLLPRWRGAAPIQRAIMAGDAETGVMAMRMEEGLDTGPVLMAERTPIARKTYGELHDELARLGADLMVRALAAVERGTATETPQLEDGVTYAKKIEKSESRIWWSEPAVELDRMIRAFSPRPGAWTELPGGGAERFKVLRAEPVVGNGSPGHVLDVTNGLTVACGQDALRLLTVQRAGGKPQDAETFLRGFAMRRGSGFV